MLIESLMTQARANTTHWLDSARPPKRLQLEILPVRVETVIVGAGIAGVSVACELAERGRDGSRHEACRRGYGIHHPADHIGAVLLQGAHAPAEILWRETGMGVHPTHQLPSSFP